MAAVSSAEPVMWQLEDLLQCMICFEPYRSPKMLKCGHTFCADCLTGYQKTYVQQKGAVPGKLPCPTCRDLNTLPAEGVAGLRNDFKVQKIENLFRTMNVRRKASITECIACHAQKKTAPASVYCFNCAKSYCDKCLKQHEKNALLHGHKVVSRTTPIPGVSADLECKIHPGEQGKYMCRTCDTVICTLCIMNDHSDHDASEITVVVKQQQDEIKSLTNMVQVKSGELQKWASELDPLRQAYLMSCQSAEAAIKDHSRLLMEAVRRQEMETLKELKRLRDGKLEAMEKERDRVKYNISRMKSMGDFAAALSSSRSVRAMGTHEEILQRMRTIMDTGSSIQVHPDGGQIMSIVKFLHSRQDVDFGRFEDARISSEELARYAASASAPGQNPNKRLTPMLNRSQGQGQSHTSKPKLLLRVHHHGTGTGQLRDPLSVVCTLQGEIIVGEWGNKRLQVFDGTGRSVRLIGSGTVEPQGVAITLRGNIIVCDAPQKRMQVFSMSGNSITKWGLGKFFSPCGVTVSPNGNYIITDTGDNSVNIYKADLTCAKRFGSKGPLDNQFDNPLYVATGQHNEIIVSDSDNHCIKVFDSAGRFIRKIGSLGNADGQLKFPRGVCTDADGSILVADRNNDRVTLFSRQGRFIRHLLTKEDSIKDPYAVGITVSGNLVVTESTSNRAELKMFQL